MGWVYEVTASPDNWWSVTTQSFSISAFSLCLSLCVHGEFYCEEVLISLVDLWTNFERNVELSGCLVHIVGCRPETFQYLVDTSSKCTIADESVANEEIRECRENLSRELFPKNERAVSESGRTSDKFGKLYWCLWYLLTPPSHRECTSVQASIWSTPIWSAIFLWGQWE